MVWTFAFKTVSMERSTLKIKKFTAEIIGVWQFPAFIIAGTVCGYSLSAQTILKELLGLSSSVMIFAWYVPFYCVSILVMVPLQKLMSRNVGIGVVFGVILPIAVFAILKK